jgi:nucleoid-associated protein YgaU
MALNFSNLLNNISSLTRGIGAVLGINESNVSPKYPVTLPIVTDIDSDTKKRWLDFPQDRYVFGVMNEDETLNYQSKGTRALAPFRGVGALFGKKEDDSTSGGFSDFALPITPQNITQTENFAVVIKPTQGGTVVQHSGNRYKDLVISGTTGVHPYKGVTGVDKATGEALAQPDELKYRSGYEVFIHFRNWMKAYHQEKSKPGRNKLRMIFKNYKDWEFLIVEPVTFTANRSAAKPLHYDYNIRFRVLGHFTPPKFELNFLDRLDNALQTVSSKLDAARSIFLKFQDTIRSIASEIDSFNEDLRKINLAVKAAIGVKLTASDMSNRIVSNFVSQTGALKLLLSLSKRTNSLASTPTILALEKAGITGDSIGLEVSPEQAAQKQLALAKKQGGSGDPKKDLLEVLNKLGDLKNQIGIEDYPKEAQEALIKEQTEAANTSSREKVKALLQRAVEIRDKFNDSILYNDETYDFVFDLTSTNSSVEAINDTDSQFELMNAFTESILAIEAILGSDKFFDSLSKIYNRDDSKSHATSVGEGVFSFPSDRANVKEAIVPIGSTLVDIALAEFGDASRWTELAELNGLKYPYIDLTGESGEKIKYSVKSANYNNPTQIQLLDVGFKYIIPESPAAAGAWVGKEKRVAEYLGGTVSSASNWKFIYPDDKLILKVLDSNKLLKFSEGAWSETTLDSVQSKSVLKPGDIIKIPTTSPTSIVNTSKAPKDNTVTTGLSASEKALGVDLKINESGDLILGANGDLELASGTTNGAQSILLKLAYEKGELISHPELGLDLAVGEKITDLAAIRTQLYTTLKQDDRVEDVRNIHLTQVGGSITITFDVFYKNVSEPISLAIPIQ